MKNPTMGGIGYAQYKLENKAPIRNKNNYFKQVNLYIAKDDGIYPLEDDVMLQVSLHEIGHALGISFHSERDGDTMFLRTTSLGVFKKYPSKRDVATLKRIYGFN